MTNEYDGEENEEFFSAKRIRLAALGICIVCFGAGLLFTDRLSLIKGLALGYIIAVLLFRQHELSIGKLLSGSENADRASRMGYFAYAYPRSGDIHRCKKSGVEYIWMRRGAFKRALRHLRFGLY